MIDQLHFIIITPLLHHYTNLSTLGACLPASYSIDTKDEELFPRAIELRKRYAGRRLQEAISNGIVDDKTLVRFKDLNRQERKQHAWERSG
jgi:hypothetical protein